MAAFLDESKTSPMQANSHDKTTYNIVINLIKVQSYLQYFSFELNPDLSSNPVTREICVLNHNFQISK